MASSSANGYQAGWDKYCVFKGTRLNITQWSVADGIDLVEITHTGHSGRQAFLAGIQRTSGSITAGRTTSQLISSNPGIVAGATGTLLVLVGSTNPWTVNIIIETVNWQSTANGQVTYNFSYKSDEESAATSITRPT